MWALRQAKMRKDIVDEKVAAAAAAAAAAAKQQEEEDKKAIASAIAKAKEAAKAAMAAKTAAAKEAKKAAALAGKLAGSKFPQIAKPFIEAANTAVEEARGGDQGRAGICQSGKWVYELYKPVENLHKTQVAAMKRSFVV